MDDIIAIDIKADGSIGDLIELAFDGKNCPLVEVVQSRIFPFLHFLNGMADRAEVSDRALRRSTLPRRPLRPWEIMLFTTQTSWKR